MMSTTKVSKSILDVILKDLYKVYKLANSKFQDHQYQGKRKFQKALTLYQ